MSKSTRLSVNVDHVATLRQARGVGYPDPLEGAAMAEAAGASGITVHLRVDRRHIQERDVEALRTQVRGKVNLEMSTAAEMVAVATAIRPEQVTLVPERPEEVTTEGGLDLRAQASRVREVAEELGRAGIMVSLFLDPDPAQIDALSELAPSLVPGFELNTDAYSRAKGSDVDAELAKLGDAAALGADRGYAVYAGHGLTTGNVAAVSSLAPIEELNIGHSIISRAVLVGMSEAVREMLQAMSPPARPGSG